MSLCGFWTGMCAQTSPLAAAALTQLWGEVGTALSSASTQVLCTCRPALAPSSHILAVRSEHLRRERLSGACESLQTCTNTRVSVWHDSCQHIPRDDLVFATHFFTISLRSCRSFSWAAMRLKGEQGCVYLIKTTLKHWYCEILLRVKITVFCF